MAKVPEDISDFKRAAEFLWDLLDDIDTVSDAAKGKRPTLPQHGAPPPSTEIGGSKL